MIFTCGCRAFNCCCLLLSIRILLVRVLGTAVIVACKNLNEGRLYFGYVAERKIAVLKLLLFDFSL